LAAAPVAGADPFPPNTPNPNNKAKIKPINAKSPNKAQSHVGQLPFALTYGLSITGYRTLTLADGAVTSGALTRGAYTLGAYTLC
jgi:hypothetical protein